MGKRIFLAVALMVLGGMAFAQHAISPGPEQAPTAAATAPASEPAPVAAPQPAPQVQVMLPSELDVYVAPAATREVCTTTDWGYGEIRTECRNEIMPERHSKAAPEGICVTRYGRRTCY
jgi:hypothetical protein